MELRHLRCFVAVAEELHFAHAGEHLHIEQPTWVASGNSPSYSSDRS